MLAGTLLVAASLSPAWGPLVSAASHGHQSQNESASSASRRLSLLDVPYISQSELLCGGAAVAMVLRYWGESGVMAEDFANLVDRSAGGIATGDLVTALRARGSTAIPTQASAALARAELEAGRPVIALIEDRPGAFHYVVLVGWHDRALVYHDPARTPFIVMPPEDFERRWNASGNWMVAVAPRESDKKGAVPDDPAPAAPPHANEAPPLSGSAACDALVEGGVSRARQKDLAAAERLLADAVYQCGGPAPLRELAGVRLLQRRWPEVRDLAGRAVAVDPADLHAWRLLGTGRYIDGDLGGALEAWNHADEPVVDLVSASGLERTTHRRIERLLAFDIGRVLSRRDFERGRRRLDELPAAFSTRLEYVARGGGRVEVRAHVAERSMLPTGGLAWALIAARTAATRELALGLNSLSHAGERIDARWSFWPDRPAYGLSLHLPAGSRGLLTLEGFSEEQAFSSDDIPANERTGIRVHLADWATGALRWQFRGGVDRWGHEGTLGVVGGGARVEGLRTTLTAAADVWLGDARFSTGSVAARWSSSGEFRGTRALVRAGLDVVSEDAPLTLWAAGDTGHARASLLRAHPVLTRGRLDLRRLGRGLAHAGGEVQRWTSGPGPLALGIAGFLDTARTSRRIAGEPRGDADAGMGLRVAIPGQRGLFRIDIARGLRDGRNTVSLVWEQ